MISGKSIVKKKNKNKLRVQSDIQIRFASFHSAEFKNKENNENCVYTGCDGNSWIPPRQTPNPGFLPRGFEEDVMDAAGVVSVS